MNIIGIHTKKLFDRLVGSQTGGGRPVLLARVVRGPHQRAGLDPGEAQLLADAAILGELVGMDPAVHLHVVVGRGRKVLADGHQVHAGSPEVARVAGPVLGAPAGSLSAL